MGSQETDKPAHGHKLLEKRRSGASENGKTAQTDPTSLEVGLFSDGKERVPAPRSEHPLNDRLEAIEERRRLWVRWVRFLLQRDRLYVEPNRTTESNEPKE